jgi:molybdopterin-containing oxidoreductase family molybdopterin binding subunit
MQEKTINTVCAYGGDHTYCILKLTVNEGEICKVESTDLPQCADHRCICPRGLSSPRLVYHPDRLKYPLKRVGARGEGKWQRISWDEALDTVASRLLEIKQKYGPEAVYIRRGGSSSVGLFGRIMGGRFANTWGSSEFETKGYFADGGEPAASLMVLGDSGQGHQCRDHANAKILILWGWNPAETSLRNMKEILNVRDGGTKLVVISPICTPTVAKADQWVPIRLGTDGALALGMLNVILEQGLHDQDYISKHTVGPLLIREDNKMFLREKDVLGGDSDKYMVFDQKSGAPTNVDAANVMPSLSGSYATAKEIICKPAFQLLAERVAEYPPKRVSEITGVPAETIRSLAIEYATAKPAAMKLCNGIARTYHSTMGLRAVYTLGSLTGNIGVRGGGVSTHHTDYKVALNIPAVTSPPGAPGTKDIPGTTDGFHGWKAIAEGKPYPIKAFLNRFQNTVQNYGHHRGYFDIFEKMDLVVAFDLFMTSTSQYADIILPETSVYEQSDIQLSEPYIIRMKPVIEPLYDTRPIFDIWSELGRRVGLGHYFNQTEEEIINTLLDSNHPSLAGITPDRLEKEVVVRANVPTTPRISFEDKKFPTPTGRIEFYKENLITFEQELPSHKEHMESPRTSPLAERYPLSLISIKRRTRTQSITVPDWILELEPGPFLDINPVDAADRGITDGQIVKVFNDRGQTKLRARLSEIVPPGAINIDHGWSPPDFIAGHYNDLLLSVDDLQQSNPTLNIEPIVHDAKGAGHMLFYDILVEVSRAEEEINA